MARKKAARAVEEPQAAPRELIPAGRLQLLVMQHVHFTLYRPWPDEPQPESLPAKTKFDLSAYRVGPGEMVVDFGVAVEFEDVFDGFVSYRLIFEVDEVPQTDETTLMQNVASRIAPVVAFPYIRETIHSLAMKAGSPFPAMLPVLNVGAIFKPEDVSIEEWEEEESDSSADDE